MKMLYNFFERYQDKIKILVIYLFTASLLLPLPEKVKIAIFAKSQK